jgi:C_GCAxxG_C_C family probable redox protein
VYGRRFGLDRETALRIAAGFAGGMRMAGTCGVVTGALMVLGLKHATAECNTVKGRAPVYAAFKEFREHFETRNRTSVCRDLLDCDIGTPEGMQAAKERGLYKTVCPRVVRDAAEVLELMLGR